MFVYYLIVLFNEWINVSICKNVFYLGVYLVSFKISMLFKVKFIIM